MISDLDVMDQIVTTGTFQMRIPYYSGPRGLAENPRWKPGAVVVEIKTRAELWRYPQPLRTVHCPRWDRIMY